MTDETVALPKATHGWLLKRDRDGKWWNGRGSDPTAFTIQPLLAVAFAREIDAERMNVMLLGGRCTSEFVVFQGDFVQ